MPRRESNKPWKTANVKGNIPRVQADKAGVARKCKKIPSRIPFLGECVETTCFRTEKVLSEYTEM